jgi:retrograde regulation protein 2
LLATEALRSSLNCDAVCAELSASLQHFATYEYRDIQITILKKEEEGGMGAEAVKWSLESPKGMIAEMGGGSVQVGWISTQSLEDEIAVAGHEGRSFAVSIPFGAKPIMDRLRSGQSDNEVLDTIRHSLDTTMQNGLATPDEFGASVNAFGQGTTLYLTGGGFRALGYLLLDASEVQPYPITNINGFEASREEVLRVAERYSAALSHAVDEDDKKGKKDKKEKEKGKEKKDKKDKDKKRDDKKKDKHSDTNTLAALSEKFRISKRRASQIPAISLVTRALLVSLPNITKVAFCQATIKEGYLNSKILPSLHLSSSTFFISSPTSPPSSHPLYLLAYHYSPHPASVPTLTQRLDSSLPGSGASTPSFVTQTFLLLLASLLYHHSSYPKDTAPTAALNLALTGELASAPKLSHQQRAFLSLALSERWGGDLLDLPLEGRVRALLSKEELYVARYLGRIAAVVAEVYPGGIVVPGVTGVRDVTFSDGDKLGAAGAGKIELSKAVMGDVEVLGLVDKVDKLRGKWEKKQ